MKPLSWEPVNLLGSSVPGEFSWCLEETIDHFTVVCSVTWPLNESEAGVDHALIETSLLFLC